MPLLLISDRPPSFYPQPVTPNQRLHILGEGRLLQIQPTQVSDSGRYLCVATNVAGEDDQDFNVLIQGVWGPLGQGWHMGSGECPCFWNDLAGRLCSWLLVLLLMAGMSCPQNPGPGSSLN